MNKNYSYADAIIAVCKDMSRFFRKPVSEDTAKAFLHHECNRSSPSVLNYKVEGLKNDFKVARINFKKRTLTVEMLNPQIGKTYSEEDLA